MKTAMAETRPWIGSSVSVAQFNIVCPLLLMDCSEDKRQPWNLNPPNSRELTASEKETFVWGEIAYAFSEPTERSDSTAEYAPTQVLAEAFRRDGCDGICYKSLLGEGRTFALFDLDSAEMLKCRLFKTRNVSFQFEQESRPFDLAKHYEVLL